MLFDSSASPLNSSSALASNYFGPSSRVAPCFFGAPLTSFEATSRSARDFQGVQEESQLQNCNTPFLYRQPEQQTLSYSQTQYLMNPFMCNQEDAVLNYGESQGHRADNEEFLTTNQFSSQILNLHASASTDDSYEQEENFQVPVAPNYYYSNQQNVQLFPEQQQVQLQQKQEYEQVQNQEQLTQSAVMGGYFGYGQNQQYEQNSQVQRQMQSSSIDYYSLYERQCSNYKQNESQRSSLCNQNSQIIQYNLQQRQISQQQAQEQTFESQFCLNTCAKEEKFQIDLNRHYSSSELHGDESDHHTLPLFQAAEFSNVCYIKSYEPFTSFQDNLPKPIDNFGDQTPQNYQNNVQRQSSISSSHTLCKSNTYLEKKEEELEEDEDFCHEESGSKNIQLSHHEQQPCQAPIDNPDFYSLENKSEIIESMQKSNKKNVVRNLMRAFKQYFLNRRSGQTVMRTFFKNQNEKDVQQKFKRYFTQRKFNHHSIKQLVQHEKYGEVFHQFLKEHSASYLRNSSVKMLELHQVFIDFLLLCFVDIDLLDNLETYSKIKNPFQ